MPKALHNLPSSSQDLTLHGQSPAAPLSLFFKSSIRCRCCNMFLCIRIFTCKNSLTMLRIKQGAKQITISTTVRTAPTAIMLRHSECKLGKLENRFCKKLLTVSAIFRVAFGEFSILRISLCNCNRSRDTLVLNHIPCHIMLLK